MDKKETGKLGEEIAENYLKSKGYKILERNFSKRLGSGRLLGEIDLIAKKDGLITFVEVKVQRESFRDEGEFMPEQKFNFKKRTSLTKTAEVWLQDHNTLLDAKWGIDVVAILLNSEKAEVKHFKNV